MESSTESQTRGLSGSRPKILIYHKKLFVDINIRKL